MIEDDYRETAPARPWWFRPALVGVALGGIVGVVLLTPPAPCSPPGANPEVVVRRFLARLGSSATAIEDCWTAGSLGPEELRAYLDATPPASTSLVPYSGPEDGLILGPGAPAHAHWVVVPTWRGPPPRGWPSDGPISIQLLRPNGSDRWAIVAAGAPPGWRDQLVGDVRAVEAQLAFVPLVPSFVPAEVPARVDAHTCGIAINPMP